MSILSLLQDHHISLPIIPHIKLGQGIDGEVYSIPNQPNQVVKYARLYGTLNQYHRLQFAIQQLILAPLPECVRVYQLQRLQSNTGEEDCFLYCYLMEKLNPLSDDEQKVFHSILSHEDQNKVKNYSYPQLKNILTGLHQGLEFDQAAMEFFWKQLKQSSLKHNDLHPRNIMKDNNHNFKLIDLDRITYGE